ncbi:MAG: DUF4153 domain-containing protein [Betaproteobacteria bacterium]|nr:DUF4153 domain-containing protein [Betaproteobacteria bacterium]
MNRLLLLVGACQGWLLWALWKARELKVWPAGDPASERSLLYLGLALPLAFYLTENIETLSRQRRTLLLIGVGVLFALLGGYSGWAENVQFSDTGDFLRLPPARPSDLLAAAILGFVIIPLWSHFDRTAKGGWSYQRLFETAWRNAVMLASAAVLTGVFWVALFAGAMLMKSIGVGFVSELIQKAIFSIPTTGIVFGAAIALGLARADMVANLRRFWLSISAWLLPLLLLFSVAWVIALPFTGLELLFKTRNAGFILLWFIALSINFANAAYQDGNGEQPYGRLLGKVLEYAWPTLLVLAAVAWWAMKLRIDQHGWTEDRVWGVFILILASLYAAGYTWSLVTRRAWLSSIGKTNIATALIMVLGLILLLSPLADARRLSVQSQMGRLINGEIDADKMDYAYLRWQAGHYGQDALKTLAAGIDRPDREVIASKATQMLAQTQRYGGKSGAEALTTDQVRQRIRMLPKGEVAEDALIELLKTGSNWNEKRCLQTNAHCLLWRVDLNDDGLNEVVVIVEKPEHQTDNAFFYHHVSPQQYKYGGTLNLGIGSNKKLREKMLADIENGNARMVRPQFNDLEIGGRRIPAVPVR